MKKKLLVLMVLVAAGTAAFGQAFTAQTVEGRVERDAGGGRWETVRAGDALRADTVIRTGIGAALILVSDGKTFSVGAVKTGTVDSLAGNSGGIRIDGRVSRTDTGAVSRNTGRISTASARAGDAAAEEDIAAE